MNASEAGVGPGVHAPTLETLVIHTEPIADGSDRFSGDSLELGWGRIFGGQLIAQGLGAAAATLPDAMSRPPHALHATFLEPGKPHAPVEYAVTRLRDGLSFSTRLVLATQTIAGGEARPLVCLTVSFQTPETGLEHAEAPPEVPPPESLPTERDLFAPYLDSLPPRLAARFREPQPIDIRPVTPNDPLHPVPRPPNRAFWFRANGTLPDDLRVHRRLFAWASDFYLLGTAMQPHGVTWLMPGMQVASLDHSIWFHRPFRFDDWLLFAMESPTAAGGRGLAQARVFDREGGLVASLAQEGLMRQRSR